MAVNQDLLQYLQDQLSDIGGVENKKMFGGIGFFKEGLMFGMIGSDAFRLKVDESNQSDFEAHGMKPHYSESKKKGMPYWEVPAAVIEDKEALTQWANKSFEIALKGKK